MVIKQELMSAGRREGIAEVSEILHETIGQKGVHTSVLLKRLCACRSPGGLIADRFSLGEVKVGG